MERPACILLLEHEPLLLGMLGPYLSTFGYKVLAGGSLEDAETILGIMGWEWADLVLCDANLSPYADVLDGYRFHDRWRERFPLPPFVFMCNVGPLSLPEGRRDRIHHLAKPFAPRELAALIHAMLR
jgi:DNA-binding response OmpR family regulator